MICADKIRYDGEQRIQTDYKRLTSFNSMDLISIAVKNHSRVKCCTLDPDAIMSTIKGGRHAACLYSTI